MGKQMDEARQHLREAREHIGEAHKSYLHAAEREFHLWVTVRCLIEAVEALTDALEPKEQVER